MLLDIENPARDNMIFDTHAHYDDERFDTVRNELLSTLPSLGVGAVINCAVDDSSAGQILSISKKHKFCYCAVGFHPGNIPASKPDISAIEHFFDEPKVIAVGEIGLDYYWENDNADLQKQWFSVQAEFAKSRNLPVIVHDRDAHGDTLEILKRIQPSGVMHCFSGSVEYAQEILKLGMYLGFGGAATFKNSKKCREVICSVPIDRILLETDAPYMAPEPYRGRTCHSGMIIRVAEKISEIKGIPTDEVLSITYQNAVRLFNIK